MSALYIVLPLALVIAAGAVGVFVWATRSGQFDDLETPPRRVLLDDEPAVGRPEGAEPAEEESAEEEKAEEDNER